MAQRRAVGLDPAVGGERAVLPGRGLSSTASGARIGGTTWMKS